MEKTKKLQKDSFFYSFLTLFNAKFLLFMKNVRNALRLAASTEPTENAGAVGVVLVLAACLNERACQLRLYASSIRLGRVINARGVVFQSKPDGSRI